MSTIEILAVAFGAISVYLTVKQNIWCWPTGIINVLLFMVMFFEARLYGESVLQVMFLVLSVYGWLNWARKKESSAEHLVKVSFISPVLQVATLVTIVALSASTGYLLSNYTDADLPYLDAAITVMSVIAQLLLARKNIESWLLWITVDIISIGVYFYKELYLTSGLYVLFLGLATTGLITWVKDYRNQTS